MKTVPTMETMSTMTTMSTMPTTTGGCKVWGHRYGTDSNGTDKGDESFA
jgi:hypothetical protein